MLKTAWRTLSDVGRVPSPFGAFKVRPPARRPMIRMFRVSIARMARRVIVYNQRSVAQRNLSRAFVDNGVEAGRGEQAAIREPKRVWTYARLADEMVRAAGALRELGVQPGDRIALVMHDSAELAAI